MRVIEFAKRLKALRTEFGATQKQLADALQTTQRRISYLESGKIEPDLCLLWQIADFFDVSIDYLIGRLEI
ncbi:MAG: helix-turn-helix transcriptional regulator [Clostridiales bacterium]|nr:helix-turn-helix transcriptional regulator [Clostridiales bacterium]